MYILFTFGKSNRKAFGTINIEDCAKVVVEKGELQLSAAERREKVAKKRAEMGTAALTPLRADGII